MSIKPQPISRREFKLGLKNAHLFKGIVEGDLAMLNHISGNVPRTSVYYFAGEDVAQILELRNSVHGTHLQENLLHSQNHIRLRQFILAGGLSVHYGMFKETGSLPKFPDWIKKEARKILLDYAVGTYGAVTHGHAKISDLYGDEFRHHLQAIFESISQVWNPKKLGLKVGEDSQLGRNALYDVLLAKPEIFIGSYATME